MSYNYFTQESGEIHAADPKKLMNLHFFGISSMPGRYTPS
ncbi:hypothetical protein L21SP2_3184 [Salinispira pacifica]|uniref:Uncharacterized protein n=1 Tax=Salinispira pacifica TaxID=1307761 RepID=V5WMY9_9SPIO|nr:hypothetical protein L21SP2_3184 [Salinispira pacifica]